MRFVITVNHNHYRDSPSIAIKAIFEYSSEELWIWKFVADSVPDDRWVRRVVLGVTHALLCVMNYVIDVSSFVMKLAMINVLLERISIIYKLERNFNSML